MTGALAGTSGIAVSVGHSILGLFTAVAVNRGLSFAYGARVADEMSSFEQLSRLVLVPRCSGRLNSAKERERDDEVG